MGILSIDSGTERRKGQVFKMMSTDIGIDLGTASILVYIKGKGVVLKEPSVVAFDRDTNKIKAIGEEARLMLGRTPGNIVAVRPRFVFLIRFPHIQYGVADFHGIVDLCSREALRAVLKCKVSICLCCKIS